MGLRAIGCEFMKVLELDSKGSSDKLCDHYEVLGSLKRGTFLTKQATLSCSKRTHPIWV